MEYRGYKIFEKRGSVIIKNVDRFEPAHVFECGQCFRWNRENDGSYTGVAMGKVINVEKKGTDLIMGNTSLDDFKRLWFDYFDLGRDYNRIAGLVSVDDTMMEAARYGHGIRILKQDFFETLVSFIISSNNSIPRIKKIIEALSEMYGRKISFNGKIHFLFPDASKLARADLEEIKACRGGYRCRYVMNTAELYLSEPVDKADLMKTDAGNAKKFLMKFPGVGEKVAECVLLYSGLRQDVFPTDVWVKRIMEELYIQGDASSGEIHRFAASRFGRLSGFAQQYLFFYARGKKIMRSSPEMDGNTKYCP